MNTYFGISNEAQKLVDMIYAPMYSKLCMTAIEMDIFSHLRTFTVAKELAESLGWHEVNTGLFLNVLTGIGLLEKENGAYKNTAVSEKYLVRGEVNYAGDHLTKYSQLNSYDNVDIAGLVRSGSESAEEQQSSNELFENTAQMMAQMMRSMQMGGRAAEIVAVMRSLPEFESAGKLLDLGCGTGMLGISIVRAHASMKGVIYDIPTMESAIRESICMSGTDDRVSALIGNYLTDDIGSGYDMILAAATLNFAKDAINALMKKLYAVMNPGGVLACVGDGIHKDGTAPKDVLTGWLPYALRGRNYGMPRGLLSQAALNAGFRSVHTQTMPMLTGITDIEIIRK